jgi:type II secretory pathway predicted ATPase ExeA
MATLPCEKRIAYCISERYIPYPKAEDFISEFRWIMQQTVSSRPKCMLLIGDPGTGKSMVFSEIIRRYSAKPAENQGDVPVVDVNLAGSTELRAMFSRILRKLDSPHSMSDRPASLYEQAVCALKLRNTRAALIDELHNLLLTKSKLEESMSAIRDLSNLPISLVCCGTSAARACVSADPQLKDRFRCHVLSAWKLDDVTRSIVATLEARLPLKEPSGLANREVLPTLVQMSGGHPHTLVTSVREAARDALLNGEERISLGTLKTATARVLSQKFEAIA